MTAWVLLCVARCGASDGPPIRVAIDAGHGGADNGCISPTGMLEKELTLDLAKRTAAALTARGGFVPVLTREDDKFVGLTDRASTANTSGAELFVTLHANYGWPATVSGFEVYVGSDKDLDEEAAAASALEAAQADLSGSSGRNPLSRFLWNLSQEKYLEQSGRLGDAVHRAMSIALGKAEPDFRLPSRGLRSQVFGVLNGVAMPAVLVETGYLSCLKDDNLLKTPEFRDRVATAVADGVVAYAPMYRAESRAPSR